MRLLLPFLFALLPAAAALATPAAAPAPKSAKLSACPSNGLVLADQGGGAQAKKLGELPPGQLYLTVDREIDNCRIPAIVRYGVGGRESAPPQRGN